MRVEHLEHAVRSFIDRFDPDLFELQELAAVPACSDRRFRPERYRDADHGELHERYVRLLRRGSGERG